MSNEKSRMMNRVKSIYMYIHHQQNVSTNELAEEFGITARTIQRDLNILSFNGLIYSPKRGKWATTNKKVRLSS